MFRRRREKRTDYRKRLALLKAGIPRLVVRKSNMETHIQLVEYTPHGDRTLFEVSSKALRKYGWEGHCGNTPAAYLTGLLAASLAARFAKSAVPDTGMQSGERVLAAIQGARDGGLDVPFGAKLDASRIAGKHIRREGVAKNFEDVKAAILKEAGREVAA